ncbi:hypothetical protein [Archaeoglobus sp.]|jgi:hypothetical protein|uniref:hypothetical protein n=1 Tax=Archaeoglobus sp. TaxID=1872626 RepID=UPI00258FF35C|nr:hypothetical protein [Archaeoglobus sp.]
MGRLIVRVNLNGEKHSLEVKIKKIVEGENLVRVAGEYFVRFEDLGLRAFEDVFMRFVEMLMFILPEEFVKKLMENYCETRLRWV